MQPSDPRHALDEPFMRRAIRRAEEARCGGDVPVGALLLCDGLEFEAKNEKEARNDATAHAEMLALRDASTALGKWRLSDATLYVTKEPCAMCAGALIAARVKRVVFGCADPKGGAAGSVFDLLDSARTNHRVEVTAGVLGTEAAAQLQEFFRSRRRS